ncbi:hypothetical protein [Nitrospira sp. Nam80]
MLRFLGMIVLLLGAFALGYAWGKRPLADLEHTVKELSRNVVDTTLGIERDLRRRQGLIDAKARIVQAKSDLFNRNPATAAKELAEAIDSLENTTQGVKSVDPTAQTRELAAKLRQVRLEVSQGKKGTTGRLDEIQKELDALLNR